MNPIRYFLNIICTNVLNFLRDIKKDRLVKLTDLKETRCESENTNNFQVECSKEKYVEYSILIKYKYHAYQYTNVHTQRCGGLAITNKAPIKI